MQNYGDSNPGLESEEMERNCMDTHRSGHTLDTGRHILESREEPRTITRKHTCEETKNGSFLSGIREAGFLKKRTLSCAAASGKTERPPAPRIWYGKHSASYRKADEATPPPHGVRNSAAGHSPFWPERLRREFSSEEALRCFPFCKRYKLFTNYSRVSQENRISCTIQYR